MIKGILFDKDGVLFDFQKTWGGWAARVLTDLSDGDPARLAAMAADIQFDPETTRFAPSSPVIAGTADVATGLLHRHLPNWDIGALQTYLDDRASEAIQIETTPLRDLMSALRARDLKLGVATNDAERNARANLASVGAEDAFDMIMGYDSGYGAKPAPGMQLAFAEAMNLPTSQIAMVGDSTHDLEAGRAAGMHLVAVLTGPAERADLSPHADVVLPSIAGLPDWLDAI